MVKIELHLFLIKLQQPGAEKSNYYCSNVALVMFAPTTYIVIIIILLIIIIGPVIIRFYAIYNTNNLITIINGRGWRILRNKNNKLI